MISLYAYLDTIPAAWIRSNVLIVRATESHVAEVLLTRSDGKWQAQVEGQDTVKSGRSQSEPEETIRDILAIVQHRLRWYNTHKLRAAPLERK